ncbi:MAG: hypothetical protein ACYTAF_05150 [Planctomycetota bacterium]
MKKRTAYLVMALIVVALAAADAVFLTSRATLRRLAHEELQKTLGDALRYGALEVSLGGGLEFRDVRFRIPNTDIELFSAGEAQLRVTRRGGSVFPESIVLTDPRFCVDDRLVEELSRGGEGRAIRDVLEAGRLPRFECTGGTLEAAFRDVVRGPEPVVFRIDSFLLVPSGDYAYMVSGRIHHEVLGAWSVTGDFDLDSGAVRMAARATGIVAGPEAYALLTDGGREKWDRWSPEGLADADIRVESDGSGTPVVVGNVRPRGLDLTQIAFPYRVRNCVGEIELRPDGFTVKRLEGDAGGAPARFTGQSDGYERDSGFVIGIEVAGMPVDEVLRAAIKGDAAEAFDLFCPTGTVFVHGKVSQERGADKSIETVLEITFRDASFCYEEFPYKVPNVEGTIVVSDDDVIVRGLRGGEGDLSVTIDGEMQGMAKEGKIDLRIHGRDVPLDARLRGALGEKGRAIWDDFRPEGVLDLTWRLTREQGGELRHHGTLFSRADGNRCVYREVPIPVGDVKGFAEYDDGTVILHHLSGRTDEAGVELHGEIRGDGGVFLRLGLIGVTVDEPFTAAMPAEIRSALEQVKLGGRANARLNLKIRGGRAEYALDLGLKKARMHAAVPFEDVHGTISLAGSIEGEEREMLGHIHFMRARVAGKSVSDLLASLNASGPMLRFSRLKASAYGGVVSGTFFVNTESGEYGGAFAADRVDLREFTRETAFREKAISGRASVVLKEFRGRGADLGTMTGEGTLSIRDGYLWDFPVFVGLWTLNPQVNLFADRSTFDTGNVEYTIRDGKFRLENILFTTEDVSLVGRGTIGFDGALDISMGGRSGSLFGMKLPIIDWGLALFNLLKDELVGMRVTGTFEKPETSLQPFPGFSNPEE